MLGFSALSQHAISEIPVRTITVYEMSCLDPQHELLWALDPQHELLWNLDPQHQVLWNLDPRLETECD